MGGKGFRAGLAAAVLAGLAMPGVVQAATVSVSGAPGARLIVYQAAPFEHNTVVITMGVDVVRFAGTPAPTPGTGCAAGVAGGVECALQAGDNLAVGLGDQDDSLSGASPLPIFVDGGAGEDNLGGQWGPALLVGGGDMDFLQGTSQGSPTVLAGGEGLDTVTYASRSAPLSISLDGVANDGETNEQDNVGADVEWVIGGTGPDHIVGSASANALYGGDGVDHLEGRGGDDELDGAGSCEDTLEGGDGNDALKTSGGLLSGQAGDDHLRPYTMLHCVGQGAEVRGGAGRDRVDIGQLAPPTFLSLDDVANDGNAADLSSNVHSDVEDVFGTNGDDIFVGSDGPNSFVGYGGADLFAGQGGTDDFHGGDGEDAADYSSHTERVVLTLDGQANDGAGGEQDFIRNDVEHLIGGEGNDELTGNGADNALDGGLGADVLRGGDGFDVADYSIRTQRIRASLNDAMADDGEVAEGDSIRGDVEGILGGEGFDELIGGSGDDYLFGGPGVDFLTDTAGGEDVLDAGDGDDEVRSKDGRVDLVLCGAGRDFFDADTNDERESCEIQLGGTGAPPPAPQNPQSPVPPPADIPRVPRPVAAADTRAPRAALFARTGSGLVRRLSRNDLRFRVGCDEACVVVKATLKSVGATTRSLRRRGFRRTTLVAQGATSASNQTMPTVRLKRTTQGHRMLRALRSGRYRLRVVVADAAGNRTVVTKTVTVRR